MKTKTVIFSYGTVKNASLKIPAEAYNLVQVADLIRESYLEYAFRPENRAIVSDECVTSSIGQANFFAGALGGYETRLDAKCFASLKSLLCENDIGMAVAVAKFRMPSASKKDIYLRAAQNEVLTADVRAFLVKMSEDAAA